MLMMEIPVQTRGAFRDGVQFMWDSSSLKSADACEVKYDLQILQGYSPKGEAVHLRFGGHYATALEHYYKFVVRDGFDPEEAVRMVVIEALRDTWDPILNEAGEVIGHGPWQSYHNLKTREALIRSIVWYLDHFEDDTLPIVVREGSPLVEHTFKLPVDNDIVFSGHLDRVVQYSGAEWIEDQKTTGSTISPRYFDQYSPDHQMSMYSFAGKAIFAMPIVGVIIDAAQIAVGFTRFERGFTSRSAGQLNEWYDDTMSLIEKMQAATRNQEFRHNPMSCGNFGGCPFRPICSRDKSVRPQFLKGGYDKTEGWDPSKAR